MIVLFLNLHKPTPEGMLKFDRYYSTVTKILKQSVYYGTQYEQEILTKDKIADYLFDQLQRSNCQKARQKFKSVEYLFIEGPVNLPPWSSYLADVALLIRNCVKTQKKVHHNGFGHIALYYYLATGFDKQYCIKKKGQNVTGRQDYFHQQETGDLYMHNKKICNSGVQVLQTAKKVFHRKSQQALDNGAVLPTKFHYLAFNAKNGDNLIKNISFPFSFYQKHKVFCTPITQTRANITSLIETQDRIPIVFVHKKSLSTHLLCSETIKVFINWITNYQQVKPLRKILFSAIEKISQVAFDNRISFKKTNAIKDKMFSTKREQQQVDHINFKTLRPQTATSSKSKNTFDKPSIRCSGPYQSIDHIKTIQQINNKPLLLGRSRMIFKSQSQKFQIQNYVQRTPSRPPSSHNFRDINKEKWMDKRNFFVT